MKNFRKFNFISKPLLFQSKNVENGFVVSKWYNLPYYKISDFIMTIQLSQNSRKLTAGTVIPLSVTTFGDVSIIYVAKYNKNF